MSLRIADAVIWHETADGVSLYHTETGEFLTLNDSGAKIWVLLADDGDRESLISRLSLLYAATNPTTRGRIRSDVEEFLRTMVEGGLLAESVPA
jgi:hypothetical protein